MTVSRRKARYASSLLSASVEIRRARAGIGFLFGYQDVDNHFVATEIADPSNPTNAADELNGGLMKIRQRHGHSTEVLTKANNIYSIVPSHTGDGGLAVNKAGYTPYPQGHWFKIGLKVHKTTQVRIRWAARARIEQLGPATLWPEVL